MTKFIKLVQLVLGKAIGHRYAGFIMKTPFIDFSFAPMSCYSPIYLGLFFC